MAKPSAATDQSHDTTGANRPSHTGSSPVELPALVRQAWDVGKAIDLSGAVYGRAMRDGAEVVIDKPSTYYSFLAGLVRVTGAERVLEIGTNCGGSALAMRRGMIDRGKIVTLDITDHSDRYLAGVAGIHKIKGDANAIEAIEAVVQSFEGREIDILFIDAAHSCMPTLLNYCIYGALLAPRYVVLDDITLYASMQRMWRLVRQTRAGDRALDAAEVVPPIRPQKPAPGFGLVAFRS